MRLPGTRGLTGKTAGPLPVDRNRPIAIVGAGIAGSTLALALARRGFEATLFEREPVLRPVGAGIQLSANALRVLDRLDLRPALDAVATNADSVELRSGRSGRPIARVPVSASDGTGYLSIHRGDLQRVLLDAVERSPSIDLRLGHELAALETDSRGVQLTFRTPEGPEVHDAPFVVAADGVHSAVAALLGEAPAEPSGVVAWRAQLDADAAPPPPSIVAWLGPKRHAVAYPIDRGRRTNLVLVERSPSSAAAGTAAESTSLLRRFHGWDAALVANIAAAGELTPWPMLQTPTARRWRLSADRVLLIGDAAHAMLPYAAQGGAMAIEDAVVLAARLDHGPDPATALRHFCDERRPRIQRVRRRVDFHRFVYHLPFALASARDAVLALRSPQSLAADLAWLYDWTPPD